MAGFSLIMVMLPFLAAISGFILLIYYFFSFCLTFMGTTGIIMAVLQKKMFSIHQPTNDNPYALPCPNTSTQISAFRPKSPWNIIMMICHISSLTIGLIMGLLPILLLIIGVSSLFTG